MRRLNKILLLFLLVVIALMVGIWEFLQTDSFGNSLSKNLNKLTQTQFGLSLEFENLDFQLFPPGANLNQVTMEVNRRDLKANARIGKLGLYFNLLDSFRTKLTVKEFYLEDAIVTIDDFEKRKLEGGERKKDKLDVEKSIRDLQDSLPFNVEKALVRDLLLKFGTRSQLINMASVSTLESGLLAKVDLRNINLERYLSAKGKIDQIRLEAKVSGEDLEIKSLDLRQGVNALEVSGNIKDYLGKPNFDLNGNLLGEIREVHKYLDLEKIGQLRKGVLSGKIGFKGPLENYKVVGDLKVENFDTDFAYGEWLEAKVDLDPGKLIFSKVELRSGGQSLSLKKPFELFNFKTRKYTREPFVVTANGLKLDNALRYLRKTLYPLKGALSGDIKIAFSDTGVRFFSDSSVDINSMRVQFGEKPILQTEKLSMQTPVFSLVDGAFFMNADAKIKETDFKVVGRVAKGELDFVINGGRVSLEELGPYAGMNIAGVGNFDLTVRGEGKETILKIKSDLQDFDFQGFKLRNVKSNVLFDFENSKIVVGDVIGEQGKARLTGGAQISYDNLDVTAHGKLKSKRYRDVKIVLGPLLGQLDVIPEDLYGDWDFDFRIDGKATLEDLVVNGDFVGKNNYVYNEGFEYLGFRLNFQHSNLNLSNIFARKSTGIIGGEYEFNLNDSSMRYRIEAKQLPLSEISNYSKTPFAFDGVLNARVEGKSLGQNRNASVELSLSQTNLAGLEYADSKLSLALSNKQLTYDMNILGSMASLKGKLMLEKTKERSEGSLLLNSRDIKIPLGLLKFVDRNTLNVDGSILLSASTSFEGLDYENGDLEINLRELSLAKEDLQLSYENGGASQIRVRNGEIEKWDLELKGQRVYLASQGEGNLKRNFDITNKFKIDASILEVFNSVVSQASGTIRSRARVYRNLFKQDYEALVVGDNVSLSSNRLPSSISGTRFKVQYRNGRLVLEDLYANLASGEVTGQGKVGLNGIFPDIDLKVNFKEAGFPIMKKSNLVVSGNAHLTGNKLPYSLSGDVKIQKLLLMNEITEFQKSRDTAFAKDYDYLPEQASTAADNFVNMNIGVETVEPIILSNSLADVGIVGNSQVIGGEEDFRVVGKFSLAPRNNRIYFKSNEYTLTKANIFFYERNKVSNPELDISAYSVINDYKVNIKVYGPVDNFKMELTSEPALTQEDVLSLIAFGYTEDLSANLTEQEKESMTQAGVGSIIFDSFKINETLKNEFGLQVNLGTEIQEESRSYISRVNNDSGVGKVSSATTIEVKKQLNDAVNLSVTSTVGGSVGQRQSMNLNYNINNKLSVEGVYETRTSDDGEETINDSSLGADVKIRWSFR